MPTLIEAIKAGNLKALINKACDGFHYKPKKGTLEQSNNVFRIDDCTAWSYGHWCYFKIVDGLGVFNAHRYSVTTAKHQRHMRDLLRSLGVRVAIEIDTHSSIASFDLGDVREVLVKNFYATKAQYLKCKRPSKKKDALEYKLEGLAADLERLDGAPFGGGLEQSDVTVVERNASQYGASDQGMHLLDPDERDLADALETAERDGFVTVYVYRTRKVEAVRGVHVPGVGLLDAPAKRTHLSVVK